MLLKGEAWVVLNHGELIPTTHNADSFDSTHGLLGQVLALIVKEAMTVAAPGDTLHQDNVRLEGAVVVDRNYRLV